MIEIKIKNKMIYLLTALIFYIFNHSTVLHSSSKPQTAAIGTGLLKNLMNLFGKTSNEKKTNEKKQEMSEEEKKTIRKRISTLLDGIEIEDKKEIISKIKEKCKDDFTKESLSKYLQILRNEIVYDILSEYLIQISNYNKNLNLGYNLKSIGRDGASVTMPFKIEDHKSELRYLCSKIKIHKNLFINEFINDSIIDKKPLLVLNEKEKFLEENKKLQGNEKKEFLEKNKELQGKYKELQNNVREEFLKENQNQVLYELSETLYEEINQLTPRIVKRNVLNSFAPYEVVANGSPEWPTLDEIDYKYLELKMPTKSPKKER